MVNISWINEQIAISGAISDKDILHLKTEGINAIVDVRSEYCDNRELIEKDGMQFLHVEVDDRYAPTERQLEAVLNFIDPLLDQNKKILVHCQNGYGRSPLTVIAILVKRGMDIASAVTLIEDKHPLASFTPQQEEFIYNLGRKK